VKGIVFEMIYNAIDMTYHFVMGGLLILRINQQWYKVTLDFQRRELRRNYSCPKESCITQVFYGLASGRSESRVCWLLSSQLEW
jgi:hypothetical protein